MIILAVDDEEHIRDGICGFIKKQNFGVDHVLSAYDGASALEIVERYKPEILVTDIVMPGMSGIELAQKCLEINEHIRIIIISGHDDREYIKSAFKLSAIDYIFKPIDLQDLYNTVKRTVGICRNESAQRVEKPGAILTDDSRSGMQNGLSSVSGNITSATKLFRIIRDFTLRKYNEPLNVQYLASALEITPNYLSAVFKQEAGVNYTEFLTEVRLSQAREMMKEPKFKMRDISIAVGYEDQNYFSKLFKKRYGLSPASYRQEIGTYKYDIKSTQDNVR